MDQKGIHQLEEQATVMRKNIVKLCRAGGSLHLGGALSAADILAAIWFYKLKFDPDNPKSPQRDRFFLSKGHVGAALYVAQAMAGCYSLNEVFDTYNHLGSRFGTHPCRDHLPSLEASTGSLGHGLPIAVGSAIISQKRGQTHHTYCLMGDGEIQEGSVWEAAMAASHYKLHNLVGIVDRNMISNDGPTEEFMKLEPLSDKWRAFGWDVIEIDGNDMAQVVSVLDSLDARKSDKPLLILAYTVKGKGVSFMENSAMWHVATIDDDILKRAMDELDEHGKKEEA